MTLLIHAEDAENFISWDEAIDVTEKALEELGQYHQKVNQPRQRLFAPSGARISIHAGASVSLGVVGLKIHGELPIWRVGSDTLMARQLKARGGDVYVLYSLDMEDLVALIVRGRKEKNLQHTGSVDFRVACISAVGTRHLARKDAEVLGLFGSGWQARNHMFALCRVLPHLRKVKVYSPTAEHRENFCDEMSRITNIECIPIEEQKNIVSGSDVVVEATNTNFPVFDGEWLEEGVHVTFITGSDLSHREQGVVRKALDETSLKRADLIYMCLSQQVTQDRDALFYDAINNGTIRREQLYEISDLLLDKSPGRTDDRQVTIFRNNAGLGVVDMAIAAKIYATAVERGIGTQI